MPITVKRRSKEWDTCMGMVRSTAYGDDRYANEEGNWYAMMDHGCLLLLFAFFRIDV